MGHISSCREVLVKEDLVGGKDGVLDEDGALKVSVSAAELLMPFIKQSAEPMVYECHPRVSLITA